MSEPTAFPTSTSAARAPAIARKARNKKNFGSLDKILPWQRLEYKDREQVMQNLASHEDWKSCFSEVAPGLLLFARQWVQSAADAEDIVQEAFVKFWRRNHDIDNRGLLYAAVRSLALDFIRRDARRARREATVLAEAEPVIEPHFELEDDTQSALAAVGEALKDSRPGIKERRSLGHRWGGLEAAHPWWSLGFGLVAAAVLILFAAV